MQKLLDAKSMELGARQLKNMAEEIGKDIIRTQKRNEKARRIHQETRHAKLNKMGYDLFGYKGGTMLIRRL